MVPAALAGGKGQVIGDVDLPHTFTFIRDYARGLTTLGARDEAFGQVWHVPSAPTTTQRELLRLVWEEAGAGAPRFDAAPGWLVRALGLFSPIMRELAEMLYEWERPYVRGPLEVRARLRRPDHAASRGDPRDRGVVPRARGLTPRAPPPRFSARSGWPATRAVSVESTTKRTS